MGESCNRCIQFIATVFYSNPTKKVKLEGLVIVDVCGGGCPSWYDFLSVC